MLLQTSFITSLISTDNIIGIVLELGIIYIAYQKWKISVDKEMEELKDDVRELKATSAKISILDTRSQLIAKDVDHLSKSHDTLVLSNEKIKDDIHKIKGSMISIETYFEQLLNRK